MTDTTGSSPGKQIIGSIQNAPRHRFLQSGPWIRDILCDAHENSLHGPDDYAFRIFKDAMSGVGRNDTTVLRNPKPHRLVAFAAACVWRMAAARTAGRPDEMLGPYAARLQAMLFDGAAFDPMLLLSRSSYMDGPRPLHIGMLPHVRFELGLRFWRFCAADVIFDLKLDGRTSPPEMQVLAINKATEIPLFPDIPRDVRNDPALLGSLMMMMSMPPAAKKP